MRRTLLVAVAVLLSACGLADLARDPGPARTEHRTVTAVSEVELATGGDLTLTAGNPPSLRITAGRNVLDRLTSEVRGDRLVLGTKGPVGRLGEVSYELVLPGARRVELSGSGSVRAPAPSSLTEMDLSGSGEMRAEGLAADELAVRLSGSGTVTATGRAARQTVELDGSGDYHGRGLDSTDAEVTIAGSGTADVQVSGTLTAVVEGSGTITYGGGARVDSRIEGSGTVTAR